GEKHLCTFCGLNGTGLGFRRKSHQRVLEEIVGLGRTYRSVQLTATDNILDHRYFDNVIPQLGKMRAEGDYDVSIFFEVKSNLKKEQVRALAAAGVRYVQPGIESFSDHILELMDKG